MILDYQLHNVTIPCAPKFIIMVDYGIKVYKLSVLLNYNNWKVYKEPENITFMPIFVTFLETNNWNISQDHKPLLLIFN